MNFVNLHNHTEYSIVDGFGHPMDFVQRAKELGMKALAITDHGSISGHYKHYVACTKLGIKPILGCEMYIVNNHTDRSTRAYNHITILAKNLEGYRNLTKLVSISYDKGFYYKPRIDWQLLKQYHKGLIATSGCPSGVLGAMIAKHNASLDQIKHEMRRQKEIFGEDYFVELSPWDYEEGKKVAKMIYKAATELNFPLVLTMDCHYPNKEDNVIQDILLCIQTSAKIDTPGRLKFDQTDFYLKDGNQMKKDWERIYPDLPFKKEMTENTVKIADMVDFEFPKAKPIEFPFNGNKIDLLKKICWNGLKKKELHKNSEYVQRLKREFDLVVQKNYVDYFLVIVDLINWAKNQNILVGPARGSSCGSLLCYVTRITEIDPIPFGLLFERFIDINRTDLPDVDIDFEDERRDEVKNYLENKYGKDRVASLATFGTFQGRLCVQDIGRVFSIKGSIIDEVKKLIVQRSGGDSRFSHTVEDTFINFEKAAGILKEYPMLKYAKHLEGQVRHLGIHAAGIVVSNDPIENFAAFYRSNNDAKVISMDYTDASGVGLLKIDVLGLSTLTVIKNTLAMVKTRYGHSIDLYNLPLDDEKTLKGFKEGKLFGIFQFDGQAMLQVCKQIKPENFGHLTDINALSRPGPLHSGSTTDYIERKNGKQKITYLHPIIEKITKDTFGVTIYQEQVMQIVRQIGKFSWKDTSTIRQTMSKSRGVESFNKFRDQFVKGAAENGIDEELSDTIWKQIYTFGSWAFNKSHSVSYSVLSYWTMYLKMHYPLEFYVSLMCKENDEDKLRKVIKEYQSEGGKLLPIDINRSKETFLIEDKGIRVGFSQILGIGTKTAEVITKFQPYKNLADFKDKTKLKKPTNILLKVGAFQNLDFENTQSQLSLFQKTIQEELEFDYKNTPIKYLAEYAPMLITENVRENWMEFCEINLKDIPRTIKSLSSIEEKTNITIIGRTDPKKYYNPKNKLEEMQSRGLSIDDFMVCQSQFKIKHENEKFICIFCGEEFDPKKNIKCIAFMVKNYDFLNFDLEDETDYVTVRIPFKIYPNYFDMMWDVKPDEVLLVQGIVNGNIRMVFANNVINLSKLKIKLENDIKLTEGEREIVRKMSRKKLINQEWE